MKFDPQPYPLFVATVIDGRWEAERVLGWCQNAVYAVLAHHGPIDFTKNMHFFDSQAEADSFAASQARRVLAAA